MNQFDTFDTDVCNRLIDLLIDLSLSDDYIKFIVGAAGNDENRQKIVEYIEGKTKEGKIVDTNQLMRIAIYLGKNNNQSD